jgi:hypothetical protein
MKWIKSLSMAVGAIGMAASAAQAAPTAVTGTFNMRSPGGGLVGSFNDVTGTFDSTAGVFSVASPSAFFGANWTAHNGVLFHPGTYSVPRIAPGTGTYTGFVVPAGMVGGHVLFDYGPTQNIDVLLVWDAAGITQNSDEMGGPAGVPGVPMADGPFPGWNAAFNLTPGPQFSGPVIPEPVSMALVGSSLIGLLGLRRRMKA